MRPSGTRRDGAPHLMRGVIIFGVEAGKARSARFYLEPVEGISGGVDAQVSRAAPAAPQHDARPSPAAPVPSGIAQPLPAAC